MRSLSRPNWPLTVCSFVFTTQARSLAPTARGGSDARDDASQSATNECGVATVLGDAAHGFRGAMARSDIAAPTIRRETDS